MNIKFLDLQTLHQGLRQELLDEIGDVIDTGQFILGPKVQAFESDFAAYCETTHAVGLNNGTSALHMALLAAGIGPGDEVITTPMTFTATVAAIIYAGATPVFADIDPDTFTLAPAGIEARITPRTRAIMPVHLYGQLADMPAILAIAHKHGLRVIEDAAQAHGAKLDGRVAGSWGDIACFSFYPGKNLGACGEAGAAVTADDTLAAAMRRLRDWGQDGKYNHVVHGFNTRMEGIQGAVLRVKLRHLEEWTEARRRVAAIYNERLGQAPGLVTPKEAKGARHVYHVYAVQTDDRAGLQKRLAEAGVPTGIHYPQPVHQLACYRALPFAQGSFPVAEALAAHELSLPMCPTMTDEQAHAVCDAVIAAL
ncbi:MAG TPA: DegT/DnrJ/EryC1/StrS family aminotransferase [Humidesulfovibrio sp.]|uniref:DegT/DnrJ/EryC1/StrS family aminotransferase n=1 Tax=Humidesulfovibrio sp. TaxID=2910988 RepID=UPI002D1B430A|nr:DegT/DnrJ/EryC1/StrS family aminotransferase [Humidesulfovibrio sp.]HWR03146.1 DegT/DnrJ/EryC1/StrS family aminotransferase [Humidesulfovibrio sp.]